MTNCGGGECGTGDGRGLVSKLPAPTSTGGRP
jgi:hypothetical protein